MQNPKYPMPKKNKLQRLKELKKKVLVIDEIREGDRREEVKMQKANKGEERRRRREKMKKEKKGRKSV